MPGHVSITRVFRNTETTTTLSQSSLTTYGTRYTYRVFNEFTVSPSDLSVTEPVDDRSILTLQTCTLPDYSQRLIIQAELVDTQQSEDGGEQA